MVKKIKKEIVQFPYWMWAKRIFWSILILALVYGAGTFYPNPLAKKWANEELRQEHTKWAQNLGLVSKEMKYKTKKEFIKELGYCVDYINFTTPVDKRVPIEMLVGQAVLESGWGQSRFAKEANNLFGIRVFKSTAPHLLPLGVEKWQGWGVRVFKTKCDSVREYIRLLNEHPAYEDFRTLRAQMQATNQPLDSVKLIKTLKAFSTTTDYASRVINMMSKIEKELTSK
jgi:Bax protein